MERMTEIQGPPTWGQSARIYFNAEYDEYRVVFFKGGVHLEDADYYTSDYDDAIGTARMQLEERWP